MRKTGVMICGHGSRDDKAVAEFANLQARLAERSAQDVARDFVAIAKQGLKNRALMNGGFLDETIYLGELEQIADSGVTPAERLLALYHGDWKGDIGRVFTDCAY